MKNPPVLSDVEYVFLPEAEHASETPLKEYIKILGKRKWVVIAPACLIVPAVVLLLAVEKPMYQAVATLMIEDVNPRVLSIQEVLAPERSPNFYQTQYELIKIRDVVAEVVDTLQLDKKPPAETLPIERLVQSIQRVPQRLVEHLVNSIRNHITEPNPTSSDNFHTGNARRRYAIQTLQDALEITPKKGPKLVTLSLQGENPKEVTEQVNMVAAVYKRRNLSHKLEASREAMSSLHKETEALKKRVQNAEATLQDFIDNKKLLVSDSTGGRQDMSYQKLDALQASYAQTNASRLVLLTRINELKKVGKSNFEEFIEYSDISNHDTIRNLKARYLELKYQHVSLSNKYKEKYPEMIKLRHGMETIRDNTLTEIKNMVSGLDKEHQALLARDRAFEAAVNTQKDDVLNLGKDFTTYNELKHNVEVEKELHLAVSKRLAETTLTEAFATNNVQIVESALVPDQPMPSWKLPKLILSFMLSCACGAGLALVAERRDKRLKTIAEVERDLELPFLGFIPHYKVERGREYKLIALYEPASLAAESYRMLRTLLQSSPPAVQTLLITSVTPGEGKTATATNLAVSFAQLGKTVLLVDADLRRPSLHRTFDMASTVGLTDILLHGIDWRVGLQETPMENLKVILAGVKRPNNPSELLSSRRMGTLLKSWKECFDLIIFDSPIVPGVPDVVVMAPAMDGVLLVHYPAKGDKAAVLEARKLLERVGARCVGMVFNNITLKDEQYYASVYGSLYQPSVAKLPANGSRSTDFIDMRPIWQVDSAMAQAGTVTVSGELDTSAQSLGLHITLKGFLLRQHLAGSRSANGFAFLTLDVAIYNGAEQPYLFDPALTTITVHWETGYSQVLASAITIPALDNASASQRSQVEVYPYDPITQTIDSGIAGAETISPQHLVSGRLVYQVPEEAAHFLFGYEHHQVSIAIAFSKHSSL